MARLGRPKRPEAKRSRFSLFGSIAADRNMPAEIQRNGETWFKIASATTSASAKDKLRSRRAAFKAGTKLRIFKHPEMEAYGVYFRDD